MVLVGTGFRIQVGANHIDNKIKDIHKRMDRITSTYDTKTEVTYVANPLGGGLYLRVPYQSSLGVVDLTISGDEVNASIYSQTDVKQMNEVEWDEVCVAPAPWADFETDKFLLQVPTFRMYDLSYLHVSGLMEAWDRAMDCSSEISGYPPYLRNKYVLYMNPDLHIKHDSFGIGYPQVNNIVNANALGPLPDGPKGQS
jgi:hypothetical protein